MGTRQSRLFPVMTFWATNEADKIFSFYGFHKFYKVTVTSDSAVGTITEENGHPWSIELWTRRNVLAHSRNY